MKDTIYREDAIKAVEECLKLLARPRYTVRTAIEAIPSVDVDISEYSDKLWRNAYERGKADRPQGEWIFKTVFPNDESEFPMGYLVCSICGSHHSNSTPCNYCDNCGCRMKGADDEID